MSDASPQYADHWKKPPFIKSSLLRYLIYLGTMTYFFLALYTMEVNWTRVAEGIPRGVDMLSKFFPPDLSDSRGVILDGILESIWMAVISTIDVPSAVGVPLMTPVDGSIESPAGSVPSSSQVMAEPSPPAVVTVRSSMASRSRSV